MKIIQPFAIKNDTSCGFSWLSFIRASLSTLALYVFCGGFFCFVLSWAGDRDFQALSASNKKITRTGNLLYQFSFSTICEK